MLCWNKLAKNLKKKIVKEVLSMQHRNNRICGYCSRCGEPFGSSARLCSKCGANLASNIKFKQGKQPLSYEEKIDTMYNDAQF